MFLYPQLFTSTVRSCMHVHVDVALRIVLDVTSRCRRVSSAHVQQPGSCEGGRE